MKNIAIIFAGGTGQRMNSNVPKQFLKIHGKEIIIHTLELFEVNNNIDEIIVVCLKEKIDYLNQLVKKYNITKVISIIQGGITGQDSIYCGLNEAKKKNFNAIVLIHDGVRPLVSQKTINECIDYVKKYGSAITVTPCFETPIVVDEQMKLNKILPRKDIFTAQAPQCFYLKDIYTIHKSEREINPNYEGIVDSCGLMFKNNVQCHLVIGNRGNIKVTTPEDYCNLLGNYSAEDYKQFLELTDEK